jgi:hypothetical protein
MRSGSAAMMSRNWACVGMSSALAAGSGQASSWRTTALRCPVLANPCSV